MTLAVVASATPLTATSPALVMVHLLPDASTMAVVDPALTTVSLADGVGFGVAVGAGVGFGVAVGAGVGLGVAVGGGVGFGVAVGVGVGVAGSGLVAVPPTHAAVGLVLLHQRSAVFSWKTLPPT